MCLVSYQCMMLLGKWVAMLKAEILISLEHCSCVALLMPLPSLDSTAKCSSDR